MSIRETIWRSNCVIEAIRIWRQKVKEWHASGRRLHEPYLMIRPSRVRGGIIHALVGELDPTIDAVRVESFKPVDPVERRWYTPPLFFRGRMVKGDTKPADFDDTPIR